MHDMAAPASPGPSALVSLSDYRCPAVPARHVAVRLGNRARRLLGRGDGRAVQDDRLRQAQAATLQSAFRTPDYGAFVDVLEQALPDRQPEGSSAPRVQLLILPPCEREGLMVQMAQRNGLAVLEPPARDALMGTSELPIVAPGGADELVVVPGLQHWFLRHHRGLRHGRALLQRMASGSRRWVVGVDAWSFRYLTRAASADLLLPAPLVCQALDASQLADWLAALIGTAGERPVNVKAAKGGADIFERDDEGGLSHDYLRELAARSLGIPWVAWHLWQRGLRTMPDEQEKDADSEQESVSHPDALTLWVTDDVDPVLPEGHRLDALLVLHSLLVHDGLHGPELRQTLPAPLDVDALLRALERAGLIGCDGATVGWHVLPGAYPLVRSALAEGDWCMPPL